MPGQIVAKMDTVTMEAELARAEATVAEQEAKLFEIEAAIAKADSQLKLDEIEFGRTRALLARKAVPVKSSTSRRPWCKTSGATLNGEKARLNTARKSIDAAKAEVAHIQSRINDMTLRSTVQGRVLYRLAEEGEVLGSGGKVLTLVNLGDVYMEIYLPAQDAMRVKIGADARIVFDIAPEYAARAKVSFVAPEAQFTPKQVETRSERDKLMFRVKLTRAARARPALHRASEDRYSWHRLRSTRRRCRVAGATRPATPERPAQLQRRRPHRSRPAAGPSAAPAEAPGQRLRPRRRRPRRRLPTDRPPIVIRECDGHSPALPPIPSDVDEPVALVRAVSHAYGKARALDGLDVEIPAGCMVGLIGPDGVGKSTLMGLIAGSKRIQTGKVRVLGGDMNDTNHREAVCPRIAYMPQGLGKNLYFELSVFENIDFFARLFGVSDAEREPRIKDLLNATGLGPFPDRPAGKLSGGMKQKVGLCGALIHDPDLLILDEPTTGVDPLSRQQFWNLIDHIREQRPGMSVLVSTAYMDEAQRFDWTIAMDAGRVIATGTPAQLMERTGTNNLEEAFVSLLPGAAEGGRRALVIPPRVDPGGEPAIQATDLTKRFGSFTAVNRVSFTIGRGEIFGFLGSNGCGKSTTMKMLTGLLPATEGEAKLFGEPVDADDLATRKRVGYMSQAFSLYGELSVRQNLDLHAKIFDLPRDRARARIVELVDRFGLRSHLDTPSEDLPLGLKQRLSLAVAVLHEPDMLLLDEPTSGVDPVARDEFWELLIDLSRRQGVTIFVSTHFMNEALRCDRISLMHAGTVLACDTPARLMAERDTDDLETAFIGFIADAEAARQELAGTPPPRPTRR